jgi:hypothetical protein
LLQICSGSLQAPESQGDPLAVQAQDKATDAKKLSVFISYNGMNERFDYKAEQAAEKVRKHALNHYDIRGADREQNFLFGPDNQTEIADGASMGSQVQPGSQLYLRPRTAGGGDSR